MGRSNEGCRIVNHIRKQRVDAGAGAGVEHGVDAITASILTTLLTP